MVPVSILYSVGGVKKRSWQAAALGAARSDFITVGHWRVRGLSWGQLYPDVSKLRKFNSVYRRLLRQGASGEKCCVVECSVVRCTVGRECGTAGDKYLCPRVQQAPKPGESLELPLGPPVSHERYCAVQ